MPRARQSDLADYRGKRDFRKTPEPAGKKRRRTGNLFVIQKHAARALHYDLRLQVGGVLKSWAVPKGPSLDPGQKRLAVRTEDHPLDYAEFEGVIPNGEYGGGTMMLWDRGEWRPDGDPEMALIEGRLTFSLDGERLRGRWSLVRMRERDADGNGRENWLLVRSGKISNGARPTAEPVDRFDTSVSSGREMHEIAENGAPRHRGAKSARNARSGKRKSKSIAELPAFVPPMLATLCDAPPRGDDWLHEIKFDGYRLQASISAGTVRLHTRNGRDWTDRFPDIEEALAELGLSDAVIDGEAVVADEENRTDFALLQAALKQGGAVDYVAFDLLRLNGKDLAASPLAERKEKLSGLLARLPADSPVRYSTHAVGNGQEIFDAACRMGLEGIISKRADSRYRPGRGDNWRKTKCLHREELVIGGFRPSTKTGRPFASLLLGTFEDGAFRYAGRVGAGFAAGDMVRLDPMLKGLARKTTPFAELPADIAREARWVTPRIVVEVEYTERTPQGYLRHPAFKGIREDKAAAEVSAEKPAPRKPEAAKGRGSGSGQRDAFTDDATEVAGVRLTNPDRVLYPEQGVTKAELARYLADVADLMMPHVARRLLSLVRCPQGHLRKCFFQRHRGSGLPEGMKAFTVTEKKGETGEYLYLETPRALVEGAQFGILEYHLWGATIDRLETPDRLTFDLDPDAGLGFSDVADAAREIRALLSTAGLASYAMLSGGKGVHVVCPIRPVCDWPTIHTFARDFAEALSRAAPDRYVAIASKARRSGRIFIDWQRNRRGATAIVPYSPRARPGAPVAMPVAWADLGRLDRADYYRIDSVRRRLHAMKRDPWETFFQADQELSRKVLDFFTG